MTSKSTTLCFLVVLICLLAVLECKKVPSSNENILNKSKPQCTEKALRKIGIQMTKVIGFGPNGRQFADSMSKMKDYCKETFTMINQVESFAKSCFKKEIIHLATVYLYSVRATFNRRLCGKNMKKATPLVEGAACINRHYYPNDKCFITFANATAQLVTLDDDKVKMPHVCCNSVKMMACLSRQIDNHACLAPNRDRLLGVIQGATQGLNNVACGEYTESSDRCDRLGPAPAPSTPNRKQYHAIVLILIDLIVSMKNFAAAV